MTPYKGLFFVVEGCFDGRGRDAPSDVAPRRQVFVSKTAFSAVAPYFFRSLGGFIVSEAGAFYSGPALRKTGAFPLRRSFCPMLARVLTADKGSAGDLALLGRCS